MSERVYLYDSTLRDGAQTLGVDFSVADKEAIARQLDSLGIDYIEGGWPGANPTDDAFFANPPALSRARLSAFGMTRRSGRSADNDPGLQAILAPRIDAVTMVGKSWDFQVQVALNIPLDENLRMVSDSIAYARTRVGEVMFDAEHFFDGYKANPAYSLACLKAAYEAGARWVVLCDTNGGTLPHEVEAIVRAASEVVPGSHLGIHCHDDTGNAVANSLAAVRAGVRQIQGTLNGLGERCGNANLVTILPTLMLKMGFATGVAEEDLRRLTAVSRMVDERLNRAPDRGAPYVGERAFAHKGGLHASAVEKNPRCYEHVPPETVGNQRRILVSDQAGRSNILTRLREMDIEIDPSSPKVTTLVDVVKQREYEGYAYDSAAASFEVMARRQLGLLGEYFRLKSFRVIVRRDDHGNDMSEATVKVLLPGGDEAMFEVAEGENGPINALDAALRKALRRYGDNLKDLRLVDYKVRIFTPGSSGDGTDAVTRVLIESTDSSGFPWFTVGVSSNVIDASLDALLDSITYKLFRDGVTV